MRARLIYVFCALVALAFPALAEDRRGGSSLDRVLPEIRRTVPGTFYDAEGPFLTADGRATYRIKWMTPDGRIIWFTVDARSGQVMGGVPAHSSSPRYRDEGNSGWGDRRNNFGSDDRGWSHDNDRGRDNGHDSGGSHGGWGNDRGNDHGNSGGWGNNRGGDHGNGGWGNNRGNDRGHDRGSWGNDRGGGDRGGRGGGDHRHGG